MRSTRVSCHGLVAAKHWYPHLSLLKDTSSIAWHDVRGNHDGFNVPHWSDPSVNPYISASARTKDSLLGQVLNHRHYSVDHTDGTGAVFRTVVFDAVVEPAPTRHFFGRLTTADMDELETLLSREPKPAGTLVMGHYPFNSLVADTTSSGLDFEGLLAKYHVSASVSGHLHRWAKPLSKLYGRHAGGTMELEVADFKYNSAFRLAAWDAGALSFVDTDTSAWPVVLVTSPVDARFDTPWSPAQLQGKTHRIRMVVWSPQPVTYVSVRINGKMVAAYHPTKVAGHVLELRCDPLPFHGDSFTYAYFSEQAHECPAPGPCLAPKTHPDVRVGGSTLHTARATGRRGFPPLKTNPPKHPDSLAAQVCWVEVPDDTLQQVLSARGVPEGPAELSREAASLRGTLPSGAHIIQVQVVDRADNRRLVVQPFTVDGSILEVPYSLSQWFTTKSFRGVLQSVSTALSFVVVYSTLLGALVVEGTLRSGLADGVPGLDMNARQAGPGTRSWWKALLLRVWGPYINLRHNLPWAFWFLLLAGVYLPVGPLMVGPLFNNSTSIMFAWGLLVHAKDAWTLLPNLDEDITEVQVLLLCLAPAVQLASMYAAHHPRRPASLAGQAHVELQQAKAQAIWHQGGPGQPRSVAIVPSHSISPPFSLAGVVLLAPLALAAVVLPAPVLVLHGPWCAAGGIVTVYLPLLVFGAALVLVGTDAKRQLCAVSHGHDD